MALDFTNADPNDPNGIYSLDTSRAFDAWVNDDWSVVSYSQGDATKKGLKNKVRLATAVTNEGKKYEVVIDERGNPISQIGSTTGVEPPVVQEWRTKQAQGQRQQDQGERRVTSTYASQYPEGHPQAGQPAMRTDYESGPPKYEPMPREAAANAVPANAVPRIEGTPRPDGTFDNSKPIMVWRTPPEPGHPNGRQVDANPLTADQRTQWEREQGIGAKQPTTERAAVPGYPGWMLEEQTDAQGNKQTLYYPPGANPQPQRSLPAKPDEPRQPSFQTVPGGDGQTYVRSISIGPNGVPVIKSYGPNGQEVAAIPGEKDKPSVKQEKGPDGTIYNIVTEMPAGGGPPKTTIYNAATNQVVPSVPQKPAAGTTRYNADTGEYEQITTDARGNPVVRPVRREGQTTGPTTRAPSLPQFIVGQSQDALRQAYDEIQAEVDSGRRTAAWGENRRKEVYETAQLTVNEAHLHEQSRQFNQSLSYNVANARMNNQQGVLEFALRSALSINGKIKKGSSAGAELFRGLFNLGMRMQADSGINDIRPGGGQSSIPGAPGRPGAPGQTARAGSPTKRPPMDIGDAKALAAHADQEAANIQAGLEANGAPRALTPTVPGNAPAQPLPVRDGAPVTSTPYQPSTAPRPWTDNAAGPSVVSRGQMAPAPAPSVDPGEFTRTDNPVQYGATGAAPPQFAAMEALRMKQPQIDPLAAPQMDPSGGIEMPAALNHTRIAATPPWLLPPDQLPDLVRQYGEDTVFSWPGMPRSEVMA
jgi:hypothetical protein